MKEVKLNVTKETALEFVDWLANDTYWGHTLTRFDVDHGAEEVNFIINGHRLSNVSNQHHHVIIDHVYCSAHRSFGVYIVDGREMSNLEYCMMRLGF